MTTQWKRLFLFLGPSPEPGVCSQSPDKNCLVNWQLQQTELKLGDRLPTRDLAEALPLAGHLALASQAGSPTEMEHLLIADTRPELTAGSVQEPPWVARLEAGHRDASPQNYGDCQLAWSKSLFIWLHLCHRKFQIQLKTPPLLFKNTIIEFVLWHFTQVLCCNSRPISF